MQKVSTIETDARAPRFQAGLKLFKEKKFRDSMAEFKAVVAEDPSNSKAHFHMGRIFLETYWARDALAWFMRAVELEPTYLHGWFGWAEAVALACDKDSRASFLSALKTAPIAVKHTVELQDRFGALSKVSRPKTGGVPGKDIARLISLLNKAAPAQVEA